MISRFDAVPAPNGCTLAPTARSDKSGCSSANCRACGFNAEEKERRKAKIRAGAMEIGPDGLKRLIIRRGDDDTIRH